MSVEEIVFFEWTVNFHPFIDGFHFFVDEFSSLRPMKTSLKILSQYISDRTHSFFHPPRAQPAGVPFLLFPTTEYLSNKIYHDHN